MPKQIQGVVGTPVTPFTKKDEFDEETYRRMIDFFIERSSCRAIASPMHIGESLNLTEAERKRLAEVVVEQVDGRVPVIIHASCPGTDQTVRLAKHAEDVGADAVISIVPYHWHPNQEGIYAHFQKLSSSIDIGMLAYNFPERIGVSLEPETLYRMVKDFDNFIGLKEASYDMRYFSEVMRLVSSLKRKFSVFTGVEYPLPGMALGGHGCFSVVGAIAPNLMRELHGACVREEYAKAREMQYKMSEMLTTTDRTE
ncbi:MAG: dihydrodipicolinate synthase family protein [Nitrososphaerota archaeon]|nr:dihydrodipicolinate synthase family protein [Nitrososphaerota archaeon]